MTVCAARIAAAEKQPTIPTNGRQGRLLTADFTSLSPIALVAVPSQIAGHADAAGGEKCGLVANRSP